MGAFQASFIFDHLNDKNSIFSYFGYKAGRSPFGYNILRALVDPAVSNKCYWKQTNREIGVEADKGKEDDFIPKSLILKLPDNQKRQNRVEKIKTEFKKPPFPVWVSQYSVRGI